MNTGDYFIFRKIVDSYLPGGFTGIKHPDPLLQEVEEILEERNQFFYITDLISLKILFTSRKCIDILGVPPEIADPYHFLERTHPDDLWKHHLARARMISKGQEMFVGKGGKWLISFSFRVRGKKGEFKELLHQGMLFYTTVPRATVYALVVLTDMKSLSLNQSSRFHFYSGEDLSHFHYPDNDLLAHRNIYSRCEYQILQMLVEGLNSEKIAERLYRSVHTIDTHRRNIVRKSGKSSTAEVILDLKNQGLL